MLAPNNPILSAIFPQNPIRSSHFGKLDVHKAGILIDGTYEPQGTAPWGLIFNEIAHSGSG